MKKRILSWLMVVAMALAMIPAATLPAFAVEAAGAKFELADVTSGVYKLVFSAKTLNDITFFSTIFSFDNTVIQPVRRTDYGDVAISEGTTGYTPINIIAYGEEDLNPFASATEPWKVIGTRTAFNFSAYPSPPSDYIISSGSYVKIFEFYFKLKDGKTTGDIKSDTFRFENGKDAGNFVAAYNPGGDTAGVRINDGTTMYYWGCNDQTANPDTAIEVINPFAASASALTGMATINNLAPIIGDKLMVSLTGDNNTGILGYQWKADGANVGSDSDSYTVAAADFGKIITVQITSSVETGPITSAPTAAVVKKAAPAAPAAPTTASKTDTSVTLTAVAGNEYSPDGTTTWQDSPTFSGLTANTSYTFYQRVKETAETLASASSAVHNETTNAPPPPDTAPTIATTSLLGGTEGVAYSETLTASGSAPIAWTDDGNLPAGLSLNSSTGEISGTPTAAVSAAVVITATNATGNDSKSFNIVISAAPTTYTVSYDANGGTGTVPAPDTVSSGAAYTIVTSPFSRTGYNFTGWNTAVTGGTSYAAGATIPSVTANITLYAQWTPAGSSDSTGGTPAPSANSLSPAIGTFEITAGEANNKDITVTLTQTGGATLTNIKNGTIVLNEGTDYTKSGNSYTIKKEYLGSLTVGTHTLTFDMNSGTDPKFTITITQNPPHPTADTWKNPFIDVNAADWFYENVEYVHQNNLFEGTSANTFSPQMSMSRGMVVTVLGRLADIDTATYSGASFSDVDESMYYAPYVKWASEKGIVNGVGNNKFAPDVNISRQDLAVILYNYAGKMGITLPDTISASAFNDYADISGYASAAVGAMQKAGIITGKSGNVFDPKGNATRAEVAAMMQRFCEAIK